MLLKFTFYWAECCFKILSNLKIWKFKFSPGHSDTVLSVGFSHDGTMVATADMKGMIRVWKVDSGTELWSFDADEVEVSYISDSSDCSVIYNEDLGSKMVCKK